MFDLIPFEHRNNNLFRFLGDWDKDFFGEVEKETAPCRTDIIDKGDCFELRAEMPGFSKEDLHIDIDGDRLTISAQHKEESKEEQGSYIRRERRFGALSRSFDISSVNAEGITAGYDNGVLLLKLPKRSETQPSSRKVEIL